MCESSTYRTVLVDRLPPESRVLGLDLEDEVLGLGTECQVLDLGFGLVFGHYIWEAQVLDLSLGHEA